MLRRFSLLFFVTAFALSALGQELKIGIWKDDQRTTRFVYVCEDPVTWTVDSGKQIVVPKGRSTYFTLKGNMLRMSTADKELGVFKEAYRAIDTVEFILKSLVPERTEEIYSQGLQISILNNGLHIVNMINDMNYYVSGVVEAESGKEQVLEFYKVQAVISRTYALSNNRRHAHEGFHLCDQVHCQVFHGTSRFNPDIPLAASYTDGQVLADADLELVTASFHSNCGGHTVNSEDVWSKALPYLKGKPDTFCLSSPHATWQTLILKSAWNDHLSKQRYGHLPFDDHALYSHCPAVRNTRYPLDASDGFELKNLRRKWKLNSTFFDIEEKGELLKLTGRGFGHGVGLCQEGAMNRVRAGFKYQEVLEYYYTDVHLIHLSVLDFFREN